MHNSYRFSEDESRLFRWHFLTMESAFQDRPPINYLVDGIFIRPSLNILFGPPGSLKSFFLADLACAILSGKNWLSVSPGDESSGYPITQGPVVWLDFDNGEYRSLDRFKALGKGYSYPDDWDALTLFSMPQPFLDARNEEHIDALLTYYLDLLKPPLLVIDNLASISGDADENSSTMALVMRNLRYISERINTCLIVIHHPPKSGNTLRGHSSIEASIDLSLHVSRNNSVITVEPMKMRDADVETIRARFVYENDDKGILSTARFYRLPNPVENKRSQGEPDASIIKRTIWSSLENGAIKKTELRDKVKQTLADDNLRVSNKLITGAIEQMERDFHLILQKGANNSQIYSRNLEKRYE